MNGVHCPYAFSPVMRKEEKPLRLTRTQLKAAEIDVWVKEHLPRAILRELSAKKHTDA